MLQSVHSPSESLVPVPVATLIPSSVVGVSLYLRRGASSPPTLFRGADYPLTSSDVEQLQQRGVQKLYVSSAEHEQYQLYLREHLPELLSDPSQPAVSRFSALNEVVRGVVGEAFERQDVGEIVRETEIFGRHTAGLLCDDELVASDLFQVLYHDFHTFTHSANVSYYCVYLARNLGLSDPSDLSRIATGALLHDLGKLQIPPAILTKRGKLTDKEFGIVKRHPTDGFRALCHRDDLTYGQLMMVYQHHERLDGGGYPVGVGGQDVHLWARICAVADVFEALTSHRPYRDGLPFDEVFRIMDRHSGSGFDKGVYECWKTIINKR